MSKESLNSGILEDILQDLSIEVRYNVVKHSIDILDKNNVLKKSEKPYDSLVAYLCDTLKDNYKYANNGYINMCLTLISERHMYNPILEEIKTCKINKKHNYIKEITSDIMHIDTSDKLSYKLIHKFFLQCVAMLINDKDKAYGAEGVLVLTGKQGIGKSLFCQKIALSSKYYDSIYINPYTDRVDLYSKLNGVFIGELPELEQSLKPNTIELIKDLITASVDKFRPKYHMENCEYIRHCSLIATCNTSNFLQDKTGNRRFFTIPCKKPFNTERLVCDKKVIVQAYAQALSELKDKGVQAFRLSAIELQELEQRNSKFMYDSNLLDADILKHISVLNNFTIENLKSQFDRLKNVDSVTIGKELRQCGAVVTRTKYGNVYSLKGVMLNADSEY
jgi:predicted P-loop ATPase